MKGIVVLTTLGMFCAVPNYSEAQLLKGILKRSPTDTAYVKAYDREITARIYLSQKYTGIRIPGNSKESSFRYRPNTTLNLGIGATYRSFSLNLAYGFPGLNGDGKERGKTRYLDLQAHLYGRKVIVDLFGQFYKGYYLSPENYIAGVPGYYIRPDIRVRMVGGSAYYAFNNRKFSYRAGLIQNEWQTQSAGTFLLGGDVYYGVINSDSLLVPRELAGQFPQGNVKRMRFFNIGPGGGYAYTFVYKRNWFATGSLTVNIPIDFVNEATLTEEKNKISVSPNFMVRVAVGYNSRRWIYTASLVNSTVTADGSYNEGMYRISTGNYRLTVARRFTLDRKTRKTIKPVDKVLEAPKNLTK
ncbi:DUF4421 domain-containing protein [Taibaiella koreensis]|uniref:DUF4421 domain-containing protein n=1 Tax=Taibaiella koreensis TaxID=1268548 RepID=UPI000E59EF82|nr:DUF4421 domain-containing protein [Taibaiella koreensis]